MQELRNVAAEERPAMGAKINEAKQAALDFLNAKKAEWEHYTIPSILYIYIYIFYTIRNTGGKRFFFQAEDGIRDRVM